MKGGKKIDNKKENCLANDFNDLGRYGDFYNSISG